MLDDQQSGMIKERVIQYEVTPLCYNTRTSIIRNEIQKNVEKDLKMENKNSSPKLQ